MSGSGGGGLGGGLGGGGMGGFSCTNVHEQTTLASPVDEVIQHLKPKDVLELRLQDSGLTPPPLLAVTNNGDIAGSITTISLNRLIDCINQGYQFIAIVLSVNAGKCDVEIRSRGI